MTALSVSLPLKAVTLQAWGSPLQRGVKKAGSFVSVGCHSASEAHQANRLTNDVSSQLRGGSSWRHSRNTWPSTSEAAPGQQLSLASSGASFP